MKISQVFFHYKEWEDYKNGMYRIFSGTEEERGLLILSARSLLSNPERLMREMVTVAFDWPISASVNLSNANRNRQAWLGQAACCSLSGCPEELTREAWNTLTDEQKKEANRVADVVSSAWEQKYNSDFVSRQISLWEGSEKCQKEE